MFKSKSFDLNSDEATKAAERLYQPRKARWLKYIILPAAVAFVFLLILCNVDFSCEPPNQNISSTAMLSSNRNPFPITLPQKFRNEANRKQLDFDLAVAVGKLNCSCDLSLHLDSYRFPAGQLSEVFNGNYTLQSLLITNSHLTHLPVGAFNQSSLRDLQNLELTNTRLQKISKKAFQGLPHLSSFTLINRQTSLKCRGFMMPVAPTLVSVKIDQEYRKSDIYTPEYFFGNATYEQLRKLDLSENNMGGAVESDGFQRMPALEFLSLANCKLNRVSFDVRQGFKNLRYLDLSGNYLTQVGHQFLQDSVKGGVRLNLIDINWDFEQPCQRSLRKARNFNEVETRMVEPPARTTKSTPTPPSPTPPSPTQPITDNPPPESTTELTTEEISTFPVTTTTASSIIEEERARNFNEVETRMVEPPARTTKSTPTPPSPTPPSPTQPITDNPPPESTTELTTEETSTFPVTTTTASPIIEEEIPPFCDLVQSSVANAQIRIETDSQGSVTIILSQLKSDKWSVIYFSNTRAVHEMQKDNAVILPEGARIKVENLTCGASYVFCLMIEKDTTSPFNCRSHQTMVCSKKEMWFEVHFVWIIISAIVGILLSVTFGLFIMYGALWLRPTWVRGCPRLQRPSPESDKVILLPVGYKKELYAALGNPQMDGSLDGYAAYFRHLQQTQVRRGESNQYNEPPLERAPSVPPSVGSSSVSTNPLNYTYESFELYEELL